MKSESILDILESVYGKRNNFSDDEINKITSLTVNRVGFDNQILTVDFNDLLNFPNLSSLIIENCIIDNYVIASLTKIPNLKNLSFYNCEIIEDVYSIFNNLNISSLGLSNINFDLGMLDGALKSLFLCNIDFKPFKCQVVSLDVSFCDIKNIEDLFNCIFEELTISFEQYMTNQLEFDNSGKKIIVMEENGQFEMKRIGY